MIKFRKDYADLMVFGKDFSVWDFFDQDVFTFTKTHPERKGEVLLVFLSFSDEDQPLHWPKGLENVKKELVVSNLEEGAKVGDHLTPWEGRVYLVRESVINGV